MRLFGWTIAREKAEQKALQPVDHRGGQVDDREPSRGRWQRNSTDIRVENVLTYTAAFSCISLIANDIAKLRLRLVRQDDEGIWGGDRARLSLLCSAARTATRTASSSSRNG